MSWLFVLRAVVQYSLFSEFLVLGGSHHELDPARIGTVAFSDHPFPRQGLRPCFGELQRFYPAFVPVALIPKVIELNRSIGGNVRVNRIANIGRAACFGFTNKLIGN